MGTRCGVGGAGSFLVISIAALLGSIAGVALIARGRGDMRTALPFGALLCPSAMIVYLWGGGWVDAYLRWVRG